LRRHRDDTVAAERDLLAFDEPGQLLDGHSTIVRPPRRPGLSPSRHRK
jgi:hypothetical protein